MRLLVADDYDALSRTAARFIAAALRANPRTSLAVPTGATPNGFYRELAAIHRRDAIPTRRLRVFQLDEYLGVAPGNSRSFAGWMAHAFLEPLGIAKQQVVWLRGDAPDPAAVCAAYDAALRAAGGLDIAVLGLGANGHLGFNEPPADEASPTRVVRLCEATRAANAAYWGAVERVPQDALTCGMRNLLAARMKLVLVAGERKREILQRVARGPVSADVPASFLQRVAGVTVLADRDAAPVESTVWHAPRPQDAARTG
jgi:glucosamine-6-phosphate deaminase